MAPLVVDLKAVFQRCVFFTYVHTCAQYASMNEFTCSEHTPYVYVGRKNAALEMNTYGPYCMADYVTGLYPILKTRPYFVFILFMFRHRKQPSLGGVNDSDGSRRI